MQADRLFNDDEKRISKYHFHQLVAFPFVFKLGAEKAFQTKEIRFFQQMAAQMVAERKRNPGVMIT